MKRRIYIDPPSGERCEHNAFIGRKGEQVRCGRRKKIGPFCQQHHDMAEARVKAALAGIKPECHG